MKLDAALFSVTASLPPLSDTDLILPPLTVTPLASFAFTKLMPLGAEIADEASLAAPLLPAVSFTFSPTLPLFLAPLNDAESFGAPGFFVPPPGFVVLQPWTENGACPVAVLSPLASVNAAVAVAEVGEHVVLNSALLPPFR